MPPRLPEHTRTAILTDIRNGGTCRGIATHHGVSNDTVRRIAAEAGITNAFARTQTENATRAKQADNRSRRAQLASDLLDDAQNLRSRAWSDYEYVVATKDGAERVQLALPPLSEVRNAYAALGIAVDKHTALEKVDAGSGAEGAASMLGSIGDALRVAADQIADDQEDNGGGE